jgi:peptidoglycan/LPS O-acetylase OafA/YrhL
MQKKSYYFDTIDILRGFAAITVVVYHVIEIFQWSSFPTSWPWLWFRAGWMGVDLFFVISGFVVGLSAFSAIDRQGNTAFRNEFFTRRLARIVPLHYLTMLVFIAFISPQLLFQDLFTNLGSHLLFLHNLVPQLHGSINGSNWSLATEMQFYILMLLIAPWLRVERWWVIALVFLLMAWLWRAGVSAWVQPSEQSGVFPVFVAATQLPGMLDEFLVGLLLARLVRSDYGEKIFEKKCLNRVKLAILTAIFLYVTFNIYQSYGSYWDYPFMVIFWRSLLAFTFGLILLLFISLRLDVRVKKILFPFSYLGTISYGIYLWHLPVLLSLKTLNWIKPDVALVWCLVITCILASFSWHFFEKPFIDRFNEKMKIKN